MALCAIRMLPLQIKVSLQCQTLPRRHVMVALDEAGDVLVAQVGLADNDA